MLRWLDGGKNQRQHPNENFARELLELFTLGAGNYSETDVREAARGLTGWRPKRDRVLNETDEFLFEESLADPGEKTFLGQTGPWRRADILRIAVEHPATSRHVCRRLYRALVSESDPPDDATIEPLAAEFRASHESIGHVVGIILRSRLFFSAAAYRRRVKSPVEFCAGTLRALEPARVPNRLALAAIQCHRQGQSLFDPPSVKGWEGGRAWLNSGTMLARFAWIVELLAGNERAGLPAYDPLVWCQANGVEASNAVEAYMKLLAPDDVASETADLARRTASGGKPEQLAAALQLLLQSPEYQLA
jgi:uncharacterized protein (DUF1800 family)